VGQAIVSRSTPVTGTQTTEHSLAIVPVPEIIHNTAGAHTVKTSISPPQTDFPRFDGENLRLWQKAAEKYFRLFTVDPTQQVEYATMHFIGNAAMWLQGIEDQLDKFTWEKLCEKLSKHFDRDKYQMLYRQAFKMKQTGTVTEYVERFNNLRHHMIAYKPDLDPTFFVTRFVEGLVKEIRAVVMIQRPNDLDTAVSLALLQEEIEDDSPKSQQKNMGSRQFSKQNFSQAYRPSTPQTLDNRNNNVQAKLAALKALRKARGECFTCGEKWAPGHKCSATVKLQFVEELLAMLPGSDSEGDSSPENEVFVDALADTKESLYSISKQASQGAEHSRSMRLLGHIQGHDVLILVDSGASNNFISASMASNLSGVQALLKLVCVKGAGGGILQGTSELPDCEWTCQGYFFHTSFKVLPLQGYDVILGMPWLEQLGLMQTHWIERWFQFYMNRVQCRLQGLTANAHECDIVSEEELQQMVQ
jgi:hypothetical protein